MNEQKKTLLQERRVGCGGTDVSAIMGLNPWRSALDCYLEKLGKESKQAASLEKAALKLECGNRLEPIVIDIFEDRTKLKVQRNVPCIYHSKYPYMLGHVDGLIGDDAVFEAKTAGLNALLSKTWGNGGSGKYAEKDAIPLHYWMQIQYYLMLSNRKEAYLAVLLGGVDDFRVYRFERDFAVGVRMRQAVKKFWTHNIEKKIPPPAVSAVDANQIYRSHSGDYRESTEAISRILLKNKSLRKQLRTIFSQKEILDGKITDFIGDSEGIKQGKLTLATWKKAKNGKRILRLY